MVACIYCNIDIMNLWKPRGMLESVARSTRTYEVGLHRRCRAVRRADRFVRVKPLDDGNVQFSDADSIVDIQLNDGTRLV